MHPIKRAFLIFVFGLGTVGGFAHGFASLGRCASMHERDRLDFEDHVADVCVRAAERRDHAAVAPSWAPPPAAWVPAAPPAPPMWGPAAAPHHCDHGAAHGTPLGAPPPKPE